MSASKSNPRCVSLTVRSFMADGALPSSSAVLEGQGPPFIFGAMFSSARDHLNDAEAKIRNSMLDRPEHLREFERGAGVCQSQAATVTEEGFGKVTIPLTPSEALAVAVDKWMTLCSLEEAVERDGAPVPQTLRDSVVTAWAALEDAYEDWQERKKGGR